MKLIRLILGPVQTNCYILCDEQSGKAVVIDPAYDAENIKSVAEKNKCEIEKIILTHGHYDHFGGLSGLKALCPEAEVYAHLNGKKVLADVSINLSNEIGGASAVFTPDVLVADGDKIPFGEGEFEVIYTPGHTVDSICLKYGGAVFCGDTLFRYSIGRTDFPTGSMETEISSIKQKLMPLEDSILLYPGHGEYTTIGEERRNNIYIQ